VICDFVWQRRMMGGHCPHRVKNCDVRWCLVEAGWTESTPWQAHWRKCIGLARTIYIYIYIYIRYIYGILGREIIKYTVIYGVYIRFWPTLHMCKHTHYSIQTQSLRHMCKCTHPYTPSHSQSPKLYSQSLRTCSTGIPDHYSHLPHGCSRCLLMHTHTLLHTQTPSHSSLKLLVHTHTLLHSYIHRHPVTQASSYSCIHIHSYTLTYTDT
jgi:hypothetical protein